MAKPKELAGKVTLDLTREVPLPEDYNTFLQVARQLEVRDDTSYAIAAEMIQRQGRFEATVDAYFDEGRELAHSSWKWILGKIQKAKEPYAVRPVLEPRMKLYLRQKEEAKQAEERRLQREAHEAQRKAEDEARRIQQEADEKAAALRKQGEMSRAREAVSLAKEQAIAVVEQAAELAEVGLIVPDSTPDVAGVGESRPWVGEVLDVSAICKAIGDGVIPLEWLTPVRGQGEQMLPLVEVNMQVLNFIAKRMGKEAIGIPGARGKRDFSLRFAKEQATRPAHTVPNSAAPAAPANSVDW